MQNYYILTRKKDYCQHSKQKLLSRNTKAYVA